MKSLQYHQRPVKLNYQLCLCFPATASTFLSCTGRYHLHITRRKTFKAGNRRKNSKHLSQSQTDDSLWRTLTSGPSYTSAGPAFTSSLVMPKHFIWMESDIFYVTSETAFIGLGLQGQNCGYVLVFLRPPKSDNLVDIVPLNKLNATGCGWLLHLSSPHNVLISQRRPIEVPEMSLQSIFVKRARKPIVVNFIGPSPFPQMGSPP